MRFPSKPTVLLIDDEPNNLFSFEVAFRKEFRVITAESVAEARDILSKETVHVVISDQRMPTETRAEFLRWTRMEYPNVVRILMTAYEELSSVIEAINIGHIYYYIAKPWEESEVRIWVNKAFERYKSNQLLKQRNEQLEKAYNELDQLIYSASHDLRGPLTSILGLSQLIRTEKLTPNQEGYLKLIDNSVTKLETILNGLAEFSKVHGLYEDFKLVKSEEFLDAVVEKLYLVEPDLKEINLERNIIQEGEFYTDAARLEVVLFNILRNAVHFRHADHKAAKVIVSMDIKPDKAVIAVEDNGIGIEPDHIDNIFRLFYRGDSRSRGAGIGLYAAKESVQAMGGSLKVESESGVGSKFQITLPGISA